MKLKHEGSSVEFADELENLIKVELIRVIDDVYRCTLNFPRPENTIARSSKSHIWQIPDDDEVVLAVKEEIERIISKNLKNIT